MGLVLWDRAARHDHRSASDGKTWVDREVAECEFRDARLGKRFRILLERIGSAMGESIPLVCQDWANTKAAYRFSSNDRVSEADILSGHFQSTRDRTVARRSCTCASRHNRVHGESRGTLNESKTILRSGFLVHLHSLIISMSQKSSCPQPAKSDGVDAPRSPVSKCHKVVVVKLDVSYHTRNKSRVRFQLFMPFVILRIACLL
jgi:Transposase DNA-binding